MGDCRYCIQKQCCAPRHARPPTTDIYYDYPGNEEGGCVTPYSICDTACRLGWGKEQ
jgi:hypothetical protein